MSDIRNGTLKNLFVKMFKTVYLAACSLFKTWFMTKLHAKIINDTGTNCSAKTNICTRNAVSNTAISVE